MWKTSNCSANWTLDLTGDNQSWWNVTEKYRNSGGLCSLLMILMCWEERRAEKWLGDCPGDLAGWPPFRLRGKKVLQERPPALCFLPGRDVSHSSIRPDLEINSLSLNLISWRSGLSVLSQFIKNFIWEILMWEMCSMFRPEMSECVLNTFSSSASS